MQTVLKVEKIDGKGRGLVASQSLKAGQVVLQDSPIVIYSAFPLKRKPMQHGGSSSYKYCGNCFRNIVGENGGVLSCPSCCHPDDAVFCSQKCQSLALVSTHTPWVCQALNYLRNCPSLVDQQSDDCQVQARFLVAAYNLAMVSPAIFQTLLSLDGGEPLKEDGDAAAATFLHSLISALPVPEGVFAPSVQLIADLLAKDKCNAFGLMEPFSEHGERSVRAYAVYPNASFFNHDCLPNACRFDYVDTASESNTNIIVRMLHDVPEGREICLSYFSVNLSYPERQRRLLDDYGFACSCDRCSVEVNWSDKEDDDEAMEEEESDEMDQQMSGSDGDNNGIEFEGRDDFPHSYFFLRYMCNRNNCGGTLAPLPPSEGSVSNMMECNVCGSLKSEEEIMREQE